MGGTDNYEMLPSVIYAVWFPGYKGGWRMYEKLSTARAVVNSSNSYGKGPIYETIIGGIGDNEGWVVVE
jgi:hypothetical protein